MSKLYYTHEIPTWLQTRHIDSGYRYNVDCWDCVKSMFYLHNETISIWTHLIPGLVFIVLAYWFSFHNRDERYDSLMFARLCGSFATVFCASAFMHTFNPIDEDWYLHTHGLDWGAIGLAVLGCGDALASLAYHNNPSRKNFWQVAFTVPCTMFASIASTKAFHHSLPAWAKISFLCLPFLALFFFIRELRLYAPKEHAMMKQVTNGPFLLMMVGGSFYTFEFPEAHLTDINFDMSRGHHLVHHLWSTIFGFWFVWNAMRWSEQIYAKGSVSR